MQKIIQDVVGPKPNIQLAWKMDDFVLEFAVKRFQVLRETHQSHFCYLIVLSP
jgi:hypothetical protein